MLFYRCDKCGCELRPGQLRYDLTIEVKAAYDTLEVRLADLLQDHREEMERLIAEMDRASADAMEDGVYKRFDLHLCPSCQRAYLADPVGGGQGVPEDTAPVDIDHFLRSLGFPPKGTSDET